MRSITILAALSIAACNSAQEAGPEDNHPLAIPAGDDGRPALPTSGTTADTTAKPNVMVTWREQLAKARVRFESLKAQSSENGQQVAVSTDQLVQKTKDALDAAEAKVDKADQVAANEFDGFKATVDRDLETIESELQKLDESIAGDKSAAASRDVEEDHE
jgi:hypothetical protein